MPDRVQNSNEICKTLNFGKAMIKCSLLSIAMLFASITTQAAVLHVGTGQTYPRLQLAAQQARAGDTILVHSGVHSGDNAINNLHGSQSQWITIMAEQQGSAVFRGGSQAFQMSEASYVRIEGLSFEQQTGNGVNIDDAGTLETPTHHIHIVRCTWRSMSATGNNDELKLSGVDDFEVRECVFQNGANGGSLVDMVGCHRGLFHNNLFERAGSNAVQAKGASSDILIHANRFYNCGERAINVGGSTGLAFFRPLDAKYEAKNIRVFANIFVGAVTPIAFVGAIECRVENNTIHRPSRWAFRILQENTSAGFVPCANNSFRNNIVVYGTTGTVAVNVGPNTDPSSFRFANNIWYNPDDSRWSGPNLPATELNGLQNRNPLLEDTISFRLKEGSPAIKAGSTDLQEELQDFYGKVYASPRSIGAVEYSPAAPVALEESAGLQIYPNPSSSQLLLLSENPFNSVELLSLEGTTALHLEFESQTLTAQVDCSQLASGSYLVVLKYQGVTKFCRRVQVLH